MDFFIFSYKKFYLTNWLKCGIMRGRAVQDSFTCPSPAFRTHPHMRFFRSQKWTFNLASLLPKREQFFSKNFFRNMSGPPRAGHVWTDPGAWFFHLQFYKKYDIIFKKGKISHENFSAWVFYQERGVHYKRMEIRLTLEGLFWKAAVIFFEKQN